MGYWLCPGINNNSEKDVQFLRAMTNSIMSYRAHFLKIIPEWSPQRAEFVFEGHERGKKGGASARWESQRFLGLEQITNSKFYLGIGRYREIASYMQG